MMWSLIRRQEVWRHLTRAVLVSLATATLMLNITTFQLARDLEVGSGWVASVLLLSAGLIVLFPGAARRAREFDLALPIPGRRLWLAHLGGLLGAGGIVLATALLIYVGGALLLARLIEKLDTHLVLVGSLVCVPAACYVLLVAVVTATGTARQRLSRDRRSLVPIVGALLASVLLARLLAAAAWYLWAVPLLPALVLLWRGYRSVPAALSLVPSAPPEADRPVAAGRDGIAESRGAAGVWPAPTGRGGRLLLDWTIHRSLSKGYMTLLVGLPLTAAFGSLLSGVLEAFWAESNLRFSFAILMAYLLMSGTGTPLGKVALLEALPVSRDRIFAGMMLPMIAALLVGYGAGRLAIVVWAPAQEAVRFDDREGRGHVLVPLEFWDVAWDGRIPPEVAACREGEGPCALPVLRGAAPRLYSLFATGEQHSLAFVAERIAAAVERVYGETITPEEVASRYLETDADGKVLLREGGLSLRADHPEWRVRRGGPVMPVVCGIALALWLAAVAVYLPLFRPGVRDGARKRAFWIIMGALLLLHIAQYALAIARVADPDVVTALWLMELRQVGTPAGTVAVYAGSAALVVAAYLAVQRRFRRIEAGAGCFDVCL